MAKKTLEQLQVEHSEMCARAADMGIEVPDELTVDFDAVEVGMAVCSSLAKLIAEKSPSGLAEGAEASDTGGSDAPKNEKPKRARTKKTKSTSTAAVGPANAGHNAAPQENTMAKTAKKKATKKAIAKKAVASKKGVKKAAKKGGTRADSMTAKIVAKMKNGGITRAEVLKMTGWKSVSMQQVAGNAGVTLSVSKERPFTYRAK